MPEITTLIIIGAITVAAFGAGGITVTRWLTGRKANGKDDE